MSSGSPPAGRSLPAAPSFARPVVIAEPRAGEDAVAVAARERAGRQENGRRLTATVDWYAGIRKAYGGQHGEAVP